MNYLTIEAFQEFLKIFDTTNKKEFRAFCLILLMYESGARVSELINVKIEDIRLSKPNTLNLFGKGDKIRLVPIDYTVIEYLKKYISLYKIESGYLFFNSHKEKLTREGANYILQKYFIRAKNKNKTLYPSILSCHCLRHSKAMHLLENGVNLIYIRDILGHSSVTTTEIYSKANPEVKRKHLLGISQKLNLEIKYSINEQNNLIQWLKDFI